MKGQRQFEQVRVNIGAHDRTIHTAIAWRQEAYRQIAFLKYINELPVIDPLREETVLENARNVALGAGGDPDFAARVARLLVEHAVEVQQVEIVRFETEGIARRLPRTTELRPAV